MQQKDNYFTGPMQHYRQYQNRDYLSPETLEVLTMHRSHDSLSGGVIVQGDRHTPNSFSYRALRVDYPTGETGFESWYFPTFWNKERRVGLVGFYPYYSEPDFIFSDLSFPDYLALQTLSKLNEKVRGSIDLSVDLLQAGTTGRMLNVIKRIRNFSLKRDWRSLLKKSASARLEYVYGWKPLASSLYGALEESTRVIVNSIESVKVRASEPLPTRATARWTLWTVGAVPGALQRDGKYLCEMKLRFNTAGHSLDRLASLSPASWVWETLPYSFVLDWIVDVGSYLRDVETSLLYHNSFVDGYITKVTAASATWRANSSSVHDGYPRETYWWNAVGSARVVDLKREKLLQYPLPRTPSFKADLGANRLLNLGALLAQGLGDTPASSNRTKRERWKQSLPSW